LLLSSTQETLAWCSTLLSKARTLQACSQSSYPTLGAHTSLCGSDTGCKGWEGNSSTEPKYFVPQHRPQCPPQPLQPQQAREGRLLPRTLIHPASQPDCSVSHHAHGVLPQLYRRAANKPRGGRTDSERDTGLLPRQPAHSHFPYLLAVVSQDLEKPIQDFGQVIQEVDVRHRLQDQDLAHKRNKKEEVGFGEAN